jgi:hypothetical protein
MEDDIRRSREVGFREHLVKPVDLNKLDAVIQDLAPHPLKPASTLNLPPPATAR